MESLCRFTLPHALTQTHTSERQLLWSRSLILLVLLSRVLPPAVVYSVNLLLSSLALSSSSPPLHSSPPHDSLLVLLQAENKSTGNGLLAPFVWVSDGGACNKTRGVRPPGGARGGGQRPANLSHLSGLENKAHVSHAVTY